MAMDDPHPELLNSALVSRMVFAPVTERGSSETSDANLDAVWEFLQTDPSSLAHLQPSDGKRDWLAEMKESHLIRIAPTLPIGVGRWTVSERARNTAAIASP